MYEAVERRLCESMPGSALSASTNHSACLAASSYHGLADLVVSPVATMDYIEQVRKVTGSAVDRSIKLYTVPSMLHSRGGRGAVNFGGITHNDPGARPLQFDSDHDMILALLAWVERAKEPEAQVAATYEHRLALVPEQPTAGDPSRADIDLPIRDVFQNYNWGLVNTRMLCPYPQKAKYRSGPTSGKDSHKSFVCA